MFPANADPTYYCADDGERKLATADWLGIAPGNVEIGGAALLALSR